MYSPHILYNFMGLISSSRHTFKACNCGDGEPCDHVTGACKCAPGKTGYGCQSSCPPGRFGQDCLQICSCSSEHHLCSPGNSFLQINNLKYLFWNWLIRKMFIVLVAFEYLFLLVLITKFETFVAAPVICVNNSPISH